MGEYTCVMPLLIAFVVAMAWVIVHFFILEPRRHDLEYQEKMRKIYDQEWKP